MTTPTAFMVKGIEILKGDEKELLDAYREDLNEEDDAACFASELNLTINVFEPTEYPEGLQGSLEAGRRVLLGPSERAMLSQPKKSLGKGLPVVNLLYNTHTGRYEILEQENGRFIRVGNAGDGETSICHCMVNIKEPSVASTERADRVTFYKNHLTALKNPSDDNVRKMLKQNFIPGRNVQTQLEKVSLRREAFTKRLKKLVRHWREELDAVEPPQKDKSKYSIKLQPTRALLERYEYDYERLIKDFNFQQLTEEYTTIQQQRLGILSDAYKTPKDWQRINVYKIFKEGYKSVQPRDWQKTNVYNKKFIKGGEDYKAVALAAIVDDKNMDWNEKFRMATGLITSINPEKLKTAYMRIRRSQDLNKLELDMKKTFHVEGEPTSPLRALGGLSKYFSVGEGHKLQFPFLRSLLETGQHTPSGQLAVKLGLMYRGAQIKNLTQEQKDEIRKLVEGNPGELAGLADVDKEGNMVDTGNEFLQATYDVLKKDHHAFLSEMQLHLQRSATTQIITGVGIKDIRTKAIKDSAAKILIRLMYDEEKEALRKIGSSRTDTEPLKKKILEWVKNLTQEELTRFIKAGESKEASKPPTAYENVWGLIDSQLTRGLDSGSWKKYFLGMARARLDLGHESANTRPFYEVEAFLKYKESRNPLLRYKEKKDTIAKVLNMLSATDDWDPKAQLVSLIRDHPDIKIKGNEAEYKKYRDDPILWLDELLESAGVDAEGLEQIHVLLYAGGTYNGDNATDAGRNIDNYLSLKGQAHRKYLNAFAYGLSAEKIVTTITKVKAGSLEHWLMRKDKKLLTQIREELRSPFLKVPLKMSPEKQAAANIMWSGICQALDLNEKWNDLTNVSPEKGDHVMPEIPSENALKAFKDEYKENEKKKKLWTAKYTLAYSLAKKQSLFDMSDRKELLKVAYTGQLEGYQAAELMEMLNVSDPKIRESLNKATPTTWTKHEKAAHDLLRQFLVNKQDIVFKDFLSVAKGLINNDYSVIDFAVNDISPEKSAKLWCSKSYNELRIWSETRLQKTLQLHGIEARTTGTPSEEAKTLTTEIADLDKKIEKHRFTIDDELKSHLQELTREGKAVEFERKLKQKIGETLLNEPEKFTDIHIPPFALSRKGTKLLAEADIYYQHYLRSGVGYHRFSVSGLESHVQGSNFMRSLWKTATTEPTGTAEERQKEEQETLKTFKKAHDDLLGSLDKWKGKQDEYTKRIVNVVNQTIGVALMVALTATGAGAVATLALGPLKAAINTAVVRVVERHLSRVGDISTRDILKDTLVSAVSAIPGVLTSATYGADTKFQNIINNSIVTSMMKSEISSISKTIISGVGDIVFASGAGDFDLSSKAFKNNIVKHLKSYFPTQPNIYKTVLSALSTEFTGIVTESIKADLTGMSKDIRDKLDKNRQKELDAETLPYTMLYSTLYDKMMTNKGYDLLTKPMTAVAKLPFADDVEVDKNKLEEESKQLAIANSLVQTLAEKGLKVSASFDYGDAEKLIEQIARKMPGVELTREEVRTLTAEVDSKFHEKRQILTEDEKKLAVSDQKKILVEKLRAESLTKKKTPWVTELQAMKKRLDTECNAIAAEATKQVEKDSKTLAANIKAVQNCTAVSNALKAGVRDNRTKGTERLLKGDYDINIVAHLLASRLYGKNSKEGRAAAKKKVEAEWRRRRAKKKKAQLSR